MTQVLRTDEIKDLNRGRAYLADVADRHGVSVFASVEAAVEEVIGRLRGPEEVDDDDQESVLWLDREVLALDRTRRASIPRR